MPSTPGPGPHCYFRELSGSLQGRQWLHHVPVRHRRLPCLTQAYVRVAKRDLNLASRSRTPVQLHQLGVLSRTCLTSSALASFTRTNPSILKFRPCPFTYNKHKDNKCSSARKEGVGWKLSQQEVITGKWLILELLRLLNKEEKWSSWVLTALR